MSKYIDAEFEIAHYTSMTTNPTPDVTEVDKRNSIIILNALRMAKTIDIVHCRECKYWEKLPYEAPKDGWCNDPTLYCDGRWANADDFCSYGQKERTSDD